MGYNSCAAKAFRFDTDVSIDQYRPGVSNNNWRNRPDGSSFAVTTAARADSPEAAIENALQVWNSEYGRQYSEFAVRVTQGCHCCYGEGMITKRTPRTVKRIKCPECAGQGLTRTIRETVWTRPISETAA